MAEENKINKYTMVTVQLTAAPIDMKSFLKEGEIDISDIDPSTINVDVTNQIKGKFLKGICPVGIVIKHFRKKAVQACALKFSTLTDVEDFIKTNKFIIVYQILHNTIHNTYMLRYYDEKLNLFDWLLTRIRFRNLWKYIKEN